MARTPRLTAEDWLAAGFRAMARQGPEALRAEPLARSLGTTKGSFYWHFRDLPDFKARMLAYWQDKVATEIIQQVQAEPTPQARFARLMARAAEPAPDTVGGRAIEPAMRAWSLTDPDVRAALATVDAQRIAFLRGLMSDLGLTDPTLADVVYAAFLGLDDLAAKGRADIGAGLGALVALIFPDRD